eukprot:5122379-Alexandrium_andersonii.AAC.1
MVPYGRRCVCLQLGEAVCPIHGQDSDSSSLSPRRPGRVASAGPGNPRQDVHEASKRRMDELMAEDAARAAAAAAQGGQEPARLDGGYE